MIDIAATGRIARLACAVVLAMLAQTAGSAAQPTAVMEKLPGVWVEGPGYDVTYGGSYEGCTQRCLAAAKCVMLEFYRPEKKCNLYDTLRPRKTGGASIVGIRR